MLFSLLEKRTKQTYFSFTDVAGLWHTGSASISHASLILGRGVVDTKGDLASQRDDYRH